VGTDGDIQWDMFSFTFAGRAIPAKA
jgi:hypothetical protein